MTLNNRKIAEEFDRYQDSYADTVNKSIAVPLGGVDYFTRVKAEFLVDGIRQHFGSLEDLSVLDLGCGIGMYHPLLSDRFEKITGVDISAGSIEAAKRANPSIEYMCYGGGLLPPADNSFDVAFAICVVHHVPVGERRVFFSEAYRVLKPGGKMFIFEHNPNNPLTMRTVNNCPFDADAVLLRQREALALLAEAGFVDGSSHTILSIPSFGPLTRSLDRLLGRAPLGAQYVATGLKR